PVALPTAVRPQRAPGPYAFSKLWVDARRYARFSPALRVNARVVGGGWIDGDPLSVQRRVSLGGPDILPGFDFRALNCAPAGFEDPALPALCGRLLAVPLELRTRIGLNLPFHITNRDFSTLERIIGIQQADLVVLGNSGTAWLSGDGPGRVPSDRIPVLREWKGDAGLGVDAGGLGIYLAKSFTDNVPLKLVLRLQRRF